MSGSHPPEKDYPVPPRGDPPTGNKFHHNKDNKHYSVRQSPQTNRIPPHPPSPATGLRRPGRPATAGTNATHTLRRAPATAGVPVAFRRRARFRWSRETSTTPVGAPRRRLRHVLLGRYVVGPFNGSAHSARIVSFSADRPIQRQDPARTGAHNRRSRAPVRVITVTSSHDRGYVRVHRRHDEDPRPRSGIVCSHPRCGVGGGAEQSRRQGGASDGAERTPVPGGGAEQTPGRGR
jgi:hypothetical protein